MFIHRLTMAQKIYIHKEPVELYKILKFEGLVTTGGAAKMAVAEGLVNLNGQIETQKRKKVFCGDEIEFEKNLYFVALESNSSSNTNN